MVKNKVINQIKTHFDVVVEMLPSHLREEFKAKAYVAGGCIYSIVNDKDVNDYDFFVQDKEFANTLMEYFRGHCTKEVGEITKRGTYKGHKLLITKYAISLGDKYQIITRYTGTPEEVCNEFDFKHNMFACKDGKLLEYADWEYIKTNRIAFNEARARDISGTIQRLPKMAKKGFYISKAEVAKMLKRLSEIGFTERELEIIEDATTY